MSKTCKQIFEDIDCTIIGDADVPVTGIAYRSDAVKPGDAFFCIVGLKVDGHEFAQDAIERGASVIVAERNIYNADTSSVTIVIVDDTRKAMALASCAFYDNPSSSFDLVGITGTNGKTTTTYLVEAIGKHMGFKTGVIGTVGVKIGSKIEASSMTTPESPDIQRIFAEMRDEGCDLVAIEVSSNALDHLRTLGCDFNVTAFTNLSQDHLDYHHTFEEYFRAKARLFGEEYPAKRVIGTMTDWGRRLADDSRKCAGGSFEVLTYGFDDSDDLHPLKIEYSGKGTAIDLVDGTREVHINSPLVGRFNVENTMCAFGIGRCLGISDEDLAAALGESCSVPGRLERVRVDECDGSTLPDVYVDYAHTPDALAKAISSINGLSNGRIIVVFGCGGDRDRDKRPLMGKAALAADLAIVTSDNPRSEDPSSIIWDIVAGMPNAGLSADASAAEADQIQGDDASSSIETERYEVIEDRGSAIRHAIMTADPDDIVLIAGKGHEDYQESASGRIHFDDREEAEKALRDRVAKAVEGTR